MSQFSNVPNMPQLLALHTKWQKFCTCTCCSTWFVVVSLLASPVRFSSFFSLQFRAPLIMAHLLRPPPEFPVPEMSVMAKVLAWR